MSPHDFESDTTLAETTEMLSIHDGIEPIIRSELLLPSIANAAIEVKSNTSSEMSPAIMGSQVKLDGDEVVAQIVKPVSYLDMPLEVKEMVIKYSCIDWDVTSRTIPACVRGLRDTASKVFYNTSTFDLRDMHKTEVERISEHVFQEICHMIINLKTDLSFTARQRGGKSNPRLRSLQIYQGYNPTWSIYGIYEEARKDLSCSDRAQAFILTLQDTPRSSQTVNDNRGYDRAYAKSEIYTALGVESFRRHTDGGGTDETWVWQALADSFLKWDRAAIVPQ